MTHGDEYVSRPHISSGRCSCVVWRKSLSLGNVPSEAAAAQLFCDVFELLSDMKSRIAKKANSARSRHPEHRFDRIELTQN